MAIEFVFKKDESGKSTKELDYTYLTGSDAINEIQNLIEGLKIKKISYSTQGEIIFISENPIIKIAEVGYTISDGSTMIFLKNIRSATKYKNEILVNTNSGYFSIHYE